MKVCAFTGHRYLADTDFDIGLLRRVVFDLIKTGTDTFLCGMAVGFDLLAAQVVLSYKKEYGVRLIACLPCAGQSDRFSKSNKTLYSEVLDSCDETVLVSDYYVKGCMQKRDRYMVDSCDVLVCFLRKSHGGTYYTVNYAESKGKKIIRL